jgi:hypothetical protein
MRRYVPALAALAAAPLAIALVSAQQPPVSVFTAEQATTGLTAYQATFASCHLPDLMVRDAPTNAKVVAPPSTSRRSGTGFTAPMPAAPSAASGWA